MPKKILSVIINRIFISMVALASALGFAQEMQPRDSLKVLSLEEVVITATRTERQLSSLPLPIAIITADAIAKAGITKLNEILSEQTGLIVIPDFGGVEGIQVQGLDSAYTLIMIDGVPLVGRTAGTLDLSRVAVANIDRIEIVKGASSSLYGSEAMAGVINVITKQPKTDAVSGNASYRYATFNTHDVNLGFGWKEKRFSGSIFTNYFATDGYQLNKSSALPTVAPYYNITFQPQLHYDFSERLKLHFSTRIFNQDQDYSAIADGKYLSGKAAISELDYQLKFDQQWRGKINTVYEIYATHYKTTEYLKESNQQLFEESYYDQWLIRPEIRTHFSIKNSTLTTGIGLNHETLNRSLFSGTAVFDSQYFFAQYDFNPFKRMNILAGFRYDHHEQYQSQWSPKLAVNYKISPSVSIKSSVGYGYKAPDFRQLYLDFTNALAGSYTVLGYNVAQTRLEELDAQGQLVAGSITGDFSKPLKPESSVNFNFGTGYRKGKFKIDGNVFYNSISNLIDTKVVANKKNGQNVFSYANVNEVFTYGVESNVDYQVMPNFKVSVGYQYLIAKDKSVLDDFYGTKNNYQYVRDPQTHETFEIRKSDYFGLYNRSRHAANAKFLYTLTKLKTDVNLRIFYRSKYGMFDTNNNGILDAYDDFVHDYFLTNVSISKQINPNCSLQVGANNLFDFTNPQEISTIPGRQIFARVQFNF